MTGKDGKVLPQCAAQIAVLEATGRSFSKGLGSLCEDLKTNNTLLQQQQISIGVLITNQNNLSDKVDNLSSTLDARIDRAITQKQKECVLYNAVKQKTERDITKKFLRSDPPQDIVAIEEDKSKAIILNKLRNLPKKIQTAIYIGMTLAVIAGTILGYFKIVAV